MVVSKNGEFDYEEVKQIKLLHKHELDPKVFQLYTGEHREHGSKILFQADLNNYQIPDEYEVYKPWYVSKYAPHTVGLDKLRRLKTI